MYRAPVRDVRFVLEELLGAQRLATSPELADYSNELGQSVLEEAARFAESVLEPLNQPGDVHGARGPRTAWSPPRAFARLTVSSSRVVGPLSVRFPSSVVSAPRGCSTAQ